MKKYLSTVLTVTIIAALVILSFVFSGPNLNAVQLDTLWILLIICGGSALYCFVVGELSHNNSQMDKLWSLLPIAYAWVIAGKGEMKPRLVLFAIVATLWGIRLTVNFGRKGAYKLKFWEGEEDYRWAVLRKNSILKNKYLWAMFNLFFISIYQNLIVLLICFPSLICMASDAPLSGIDYTAVAFALSFLLLETAADEQQMSFYNTRKILMNEGKALEDIVFPFNLGFNTFGLWNRMRHPNYLGEQGVWTSLYFLTAGAGLTTYGIFNWSIVGPGLLILLFLGSSVFGESISKSKYPSYEEYQNKVSKYLPFRKYR